MKHFIEIGIVAFLFGVICSGCGAMESLPPAEGLKANGMPSGLEIAEANTVVVIAESSESHIGLAESSLSGLALRYQSPSGETQFQVGLPNPAILELENLFRDRIEDCRKSSLESNGTFEDEISRDTTIVLRSHRVFNSIQTQNIELPTGLRPISYQEADQLITFVSVRANAICKAAER